MDSRSVMRAGSLTRRSLPGVPVLAACLIIAACGGGGQGSGNSSPTMLPPTNAFSGNVTLNGAPLPGVTIVAFDTKTNEVFGTTTTDQTANYTLSGLNTSCNDNCIHDYRFLAFKNGYAFSSGLGNVPAQYTSHVRWYVPPAG